MKIFILKRNACYFNTFTPNKRERIALFKSRASYFSVRCLLVRLHLPLWWRLKTHGTRKTGRREEERKTSWWKSVFVFLLLAGVNKKDAAANGPHSMCICDETAEQSGLQTCVMKAGGRFYKPSPPFKTMWLTHTSLPWQERLKKKTKVNFDTTLTVLLSCQ